MWARASASGSPVLGSCAVGRGAAGAVVHHSSVPAGDHARVQDATVRHSLRKHRVVSPLFIACSMLWYHTNRRNVVLKFSIVSSYPFLLPGAVPRKNLWPRLRQPTSRLASRQWAWTIQLQHPTTLLLLGSCNKPPCASGIWLCVVSLPCRTGQRYAPTVRYVVCLFACLPAHATAYSSTLPPAVFVSLVLPSSPCPAMHKARALYRPSLYSYTRDTCAMVENCRTRARCVVAG